MAGIGNNLYPPIFSHAYMPAFVGNCKIYFSLSNFNSLSQLKNEGGNAAVQISIRNQKNNQSVLTDSYPAGIKLSSIEIDTSRTGDDIYYITIADSDIKGGFDSSIYYKVQLRFTGQGATDTISATNAWLNLNQKYFSEWSTVILIKSLSSIPVLSLNNFDKNVVTILNSEELTIIGKVDFNQNDNEILKTYTIHLYDENNILLEDSG